MTLADKINEARTSYEVALRLCRENAPNRYTMAGDYEDALAASRTYQKKAQCYLNRMVQLIRRKNKLAA